MVEDPRKLYESLDTTQNKQAPILHVRVQGRSRDIALDLLDVSASSSDEAVRTAVARFMEITPELLKNTVIERHNNGNMTLRPEAIFG